MANECKLSKSYAVNADELYSYCCSALKSSGFTYEKGDKNFGKLAAISSNFQKMEINILPKGSSNSIIEIEIYSPNISGKKALIQPPTKFLLPLMNKFVEALDFIVNRSALMK